MNWIKENKFLAGFLAAMLVGAGALGFLFLSAKGKYQEALAAYQEKAGELSGLVKRPIFPSQKNVDKLVEQKKQVVDKAAELAKSLVAQQVPVEEMTPAQFQDKLKAAVSALKAKARPGQLGDGTVDKFFLGFDKYETAPPDAEAAVALGRQLKVLDWVVGKLIETGATQIKITRPELTEEQGKAKVDDKKPAGGKPDKASKIAVRKNPFEIEFIAEQANFKQALNAIIEHKGQFLIPRVLTVKNSAEKAPARVLAGAAAIDPGAAAAVPPPPATNPDGTPAAAPALPATPGAAAASATYIVGEEKVAVRLVLEAVDFMEVASK
jgi:hypothetical protein